MHSLSSRLPVILDTKYLVRSDPSLRSTLAKDRADLGGLFLAAQEYDKETKNPHTLKISVGEEKYTFFSFSDFWGDIGGT